MKKYRREFNTLLSIRSRINPLLLALSILFIPFTAQATKVSDKELHTLFIDEQHQPGKKTVPLSMLLCVISLAKLSSTYHEQHGSNQPTLSSEKCQEELQNILESKKRNPSGLELKDITTQDVAVRLSFIATEFDMLHALGENNDNNRKLANYAGRFFATMTAVENGVIQLNTRCDEVNEILTDVATKQLNIRHRNSLEQFCNGTAPNPDFKGNLAAALLLKTIEIFNYASKVDRKPVTEKFNFADFEKMLDQVENFDKFIDDVIVQSREQLTNTTISRNVQQPAESDIQAASKRLQQNKEHLDNIINSFDQKMSDLDSACAQIDQLKTQAQDKQITLDQKYGNTLCGKTARVSFLSMLKESRRHAETIDVTELAIRPNLLLSTESYIDQFKQKSTAIYTDLGKLQTLVERNSGSKEMENESSQVENSDQTLSELSVMFYEDIFNPVFGLEYLNRKMLDYSIDSLSYVDDYLEEVRKLEMTQKERVVLTLRTGAYVGEVLRRQDKSKEWDWLNFDQMSALDPKTASTFGNTEATMAVLYSEGGFAFPLAKVQKYLANGSVDSVQFFVQALLTKPTKTE